MVAVENAPNSAMASLFRGHIESDRENYDKAAYYYHQALSEDPELLDAYYSLGLYYGYIKKDISKAESYFLQAIEVARKTKDTEPEKLFHAKKQYEDSMFLLKNQK